LRKLQENLHGWSWPFPFASDNTLETLCNWTLLPAWVRDCTFVWPDGIEGPCCVEAKCTFSMCNLALFCWTDLPRESSKEVKRRLYMSLIQRMMTRTYGNTMETERFGERPLSKTNLE
jgi:hypothetical protein